MPSRPRVYVAAILTSTFLVLALWVLLPLLDGQRVPATTKANYPQYVKEIYSVRPVSGLAVADESTSIATSRSAIVLVENQGSATERVRVPMTYYATQCGAPISIAVVVEGQVATTGIVDKERPTTDLSIDLEMPPHSSLLVPLEIEGLPCAPFDAAGTTFGALRLGTVTPKFAR